MKYFKNINTIEELKDEYRRLAFVNHPDIGGNVETMQEINAEFELAYRITVKKNPVNNTKTETAGEFKNYFYTQNGWAGKRYNCELRLRDIAPIIRSYIKDVYPTWKFSVVQEHYSGGCSLYVSLMEAPENIFSEEGIKQWARKIQNQWHWTEEQAIASCMETINRGYIQNWKSYYEYMTDYAKEVLNDIEKLVNSYRYSDSDAMIDYFSTNFYSHLYIGKWNKPLKIVHRTERITTNEAVKGARRLTA